MVFSAPEITTVSKPNRNPASADVSDQRKMRAFILGTRAAYHRIVRFPVRIRSVLYERIGFLSPAPNAAIHRDHIRVAHLLQTVSRKCRAEAAAAVQNHLLVEIRHARFNITLDYPLAQMNRTRKMVLRILAFLAYIDEQELVPPVHPVLHVVDI